MSKEERAARVKAREERTKKKEEAAKRMANQAIRSKKADSNELNDAEKEQQKERYAKDEGETKEEVNILEEEESNPTSLTPTREARLAAFLLKKACLKKKKKRTKKPFTGSRLPRDSSGNIFIRW